MRVPQLRGWLGSPRDRVASAWKRLLCSHADVSRPPQANWTRVELLRAALNAYAALGLRLDAARTRLELARVLAGESPDAAVDLAKRARNELDALGASREADAAAALMRSLGAKGRAGPKALGLLSRRELEVLRLLGEGLSNREIAERLFISPKTAEHHVSRIYAKLDLSTRAEAAAYAVRSLGDE